MEKKALHENSSLASGLKEITNKTAQQGRKTASRAQDGPENQRKRKCSPVLDKENVQSPDPASPQSVASRPEQNALRVDLENPGFSERMNKVNECEGVELSSFRESREVNYQSDSTQSDSIEFDPAFSQNDQLECTQTETAFEPSPDELPLHSNKFLSDFDSIEKIGKGGFGRVFKARHKLRDTSFAIKIVRCEENSSREVEAWRGFSHDNIIKFFNCWFEDCEYNTGSSLESCSSSSGSQNEPEKYLYIQMELCIGKTLKEWIDEKKFEIKVEVFERQKQSLDIIHQIVSGIEYIHLKGFIHRDLKPDNIMIDYKNQVKIGDFGLVTKDNDPMEDPLERTASKGTESYMAPEQNDKNYNRKVDIFAVGIIYFELLWPLSTHHERATVLKDVRKKKLPQKFRAKFFEEYNILMPVLEENPDLRPEATELMTALENYKSQKSLVLIFPGKSV